ncbi:MAG: hypothetical protein ACK6C4_06855, partial [Bacteroidota bacterium]
GLNSLADLPKLREIDDLLKTTTTMIDMDDSVAIQTDHRTLRKQLAILLESGDDQSKGQSPASSEATSGAYWQPASEEIEGDTQESADEQAPQDATS